MLYTVKNMRIPKFLDLEWFSQQGFNFPDLLEAQGLSKLVQMKGTFYLVLVKVFYTCVYADMEGNMFSTVNGVKGNFVRMGQEFHANGVFPRGGKCIFYCFNIQKRKSYGLGGI